MKIEILYPEIANLYGDLANAKYLARSSGAEMVTTKLGEKPRFLTEDIALVTLGGTTERGQEIVRDALKPYAEALKNRRGLTLVTGNAVELFGEYIEKDDGGRIEMLGLYPFHAVRRMMARHNSLYLGSFENTKIVGFKSQFTFAYGQFDRPLFNTERGVGMNPGEKAEGIRDGGLMLTYILGPIAILNPDFAKYLLGEMGVENPTLAFEKEAYEVYRTRLREFEDPARGFGYGN